MVVAFNIETLYKKYFIEYLRITVLNISPKGQDQLDFEQSGLEIV